MSTLPGETALASELHVGIGPNTSLRGIGFPFEQLSREEKVQPLIPTSVVKAHDFGSRELI